MDKQHISRTPRFVAPSLKSAATGFQHRDRNIVPERFLVWCTKASKLRIQQRHVRNNAFLIRSVPLRVVFVCVRGKKRILCDGLRIHRRHGSQNGRTCRHMNAHNRKPKLYVVPLRGCATVYVSDGDAKNKLHAIIWCPVRFINTTPSRAGSQSTCGLIQDKRRLSILMFLVEIAGRDYCIASFQGMSA